MDNICLLSDSYKFAHYKMYPKNTRTIYSYLECRKWAKYPKTVFFGLQSILLKNMVGRRVTREKITVAKTIIQNHFGQNLFNEDGWLHIVKKHNGYLPLSIKAVPEGTPVDINNVMMTVENTDPKCYWLTNFVESLLTHVWYPSTVATISYYTKRTLAEYLNISSEQTQCLDFMLHDFGYRGVSSNESASLGGLAHLINFKGTDTVPALLEGIEYYQADPKTLGFSVPATEHSIMTSYDHQGEVTLVNELLQKYPNGILSIVADSYDIYNFVENIIPKFKQQIINRKANKSGIAKVVIRPDSITQQHKHPGKQIVWILKQLANTFGYHVNSKGYTVINPVVGVLWGDGLSVNTITEICKIVVENKFSVESLVFGMGGGLLQKINRDTQAFAFKCSAQKRCNTWHDISKRPKDKNKQSKKGRLRLIYADDEKCFKTVNYDYLPQHINKLVEVYRNGRLLVTQKFDTIRQRSLQ